MSSNNPYQSPATVSKKHNQQKQPEGYGGIGRLAYFLISIAVGVASAGVEFFAEANSIGGLEFATLAVGFISNITLAGLRLKNMGYRGMWVLGLFVPLLNILVSVRCVAAPEGYADHKTFDTAGKTIIGILLGLFVLFVLALFLA